MRVPTTLQNAVFLLLLNAVAACAQGRCFAFLNGDVSVSCNGGHYRLTSSESIEGFAISEKPPYLVTTTTEILGRRKDAEDTRDLATVVDLKSGKSRTLPAANRWVISTCGGVLVRTAQGALDVISGQEVRMDPYTLFRCTPDRRTVVGVPKGGGLFKGIPPKEEVATAASLHRFAFNLSPDGSKTVYRNGKSLCLSRSPGTAECAEYSGGALLDSPSVNDAGEVLVAAQTPEPCSYRTSTNFSPTPPPNWHVIGGDACVKIGYWKPGLASIQLLDIYAGNPQWITPAVAERLRDWAAHRADPPQGK